MWVRKNATCPHSQTQPRSATAFSIEVGLPVYEVSHASVNGGSHSQKALLQKFVATVFECTDNKNIALQNV